MSDLKYWDVRFESVCKWKMPKAECEGKTGNQGSGASRATEDKGCSFIPQIFAECLQCVRHHSWHWEYRGEESLLKAAPGACLHGTIPYRCYCWTCCPLRQPCPSHWIRSRFCKVLVNPFLTSTCPNDQVQETSKSMLWIIFLMLWLLLWRPNRKRWHGPFGLGKVDPAGHDACASMMLGPSGREPYGEEGRHGDKSLLLSTTFQ